MTKKGISPVVAVVLLIGIAVMLGGLVSSWLSSFIHQNSQQSTCALTTMYVISEAQVNESSGYLAVKLKNTGQSGISNFTFEVYNGTVYDALTATSPDDSYVLQPGRTQLIKTNFTDQSITSTNITEISTVTVISESCPEYSPEPIKVVNI